MKENTRILILVFVVAFLTLLVGCYPKLNQAPIITSDPVKTATVGKAYTYDVDATDPDGDTLTYSLTVRPEDMTIDPDTGIIEWDPQILEQLGLYQVIVEVSDGRETAIQSFTITVIEEEEPPKLTSIVVVPDTITLSLGATKQLKVTAYYNDGFTPKITSDCNYVSSDPSIAFVSVNGLIVGEGFGTATITVTYISDEVVFTDTVKITVSNNVDFDPWVDD